MIKFISLFFVGTFVMGFGPAYSVAPASSTPTRVIAAATKQCEREVTQNCVVKQCPDFCKASFANRHAGKDALIQKCSKECTPGHRCKLSPLGHAGHTDNTVLENQTRAQLMQCIAQVRDPQAVHSGRSKKDWKLVQSPTWRKLMAIQNPSSQQLKK